MTKDLPEAPAQTGATPELIMRLGTSFMATKHLIAAVEVGLFEALGDAALDLDPLAARIAIPRRTARICADAMVAVGLLERDGPLYRNSAAADAFLSGRGPRDLRPFLRSMDRNYRIVTVSAGADQSRSGPFGSMEIFGLGPGVPVEEFVDVRLVDPGEAAGRQRG